MKLRTAYLLSCLFLIALFASSAFGQANGKLQIHFIDVGQGDGALLISPLGETVLFDNGKRGNCDLPVSYLQQLGTTRIDYMIVSHYHDDHIGCTTEVLTEFPIQKKGYDRGGTYSSSTFQKYLTRLGAKRTTASVGTTITLDSGSANPVKIEIVALSGNGVATTNENDLSVVATVRFGNFDAVIGGDLSGFKTGSYEDIETSVAPKVGQVEVYKVNHHGSSYSSNDVWLATIKPKIGVVSTGVGNVYGHPTQECLDRLHAAGVKTYWTEVGNGVEPDPTFDTIGKNIVVEATPGSWSFTVTYGSNQVDTYADWGAPPDAETEATFAWSKNSSVYHFAHCKFVKNISAANLQKGNTPPAGKTLHNGCPK
jgi:beta-lactamase superfamily II metal-dependent hydrolase